MTLGRVLLASILGIILLSGTVGLGIVLVGLVNASDDLHEDLTETLAVTELASLIRADTDLARFVATGSELTGTDESRHEGAWEPALIDAMAAVDRFERAEIEELVELHSLLVTATERLAELPLGLRADAYLADIGRLESEIRDIFNEVTVDEQGSLEGVHGDLHGIRQIGVIGIPVLVLFWALAIGAALNYRNAIRSTRLKQLQQKNEEKNQFLATMSHELRTPLTAVIGMSAQLERETFGPLNDKQAEYVSHIARSGGHLLSLIDDLLDLERVEAGKDDLTLEHLSVAAVVADSLTLVREMAASREVNLVADLPDDLPLLIGDERRVKQIFVNLLSNAITFTPVGGSIGVETTTGESTIGVTVWDTGRGISAEDLTRIFEPFEKSGTEVDSRGRGLGLALTTQLVKLHGGTISVTSDIGVGSRFTVSLPTAQTPSIAEEQQADTAPAFPDQPSDGNKRVRVLVAEDHEINRRLFTDTLSVAGFEVAIAENGREAVERAGTFRPDVVLMDIRMPVMGGLEATRLLKASASTRDIAVIALTAQGVSNDEEQCHEAGCDAYLSKPVDPAEIIRVVRSFTDAPQTDRALTSRLV